MSERDAQEYEMVDESQPEATGREKGEKMYASPSTSSNVGPQFEDTYVPNSPISSDPEEYHEPPKKIPKKQKTSETATQIMDESLMTKVSSPIENLRSTRKRALRNESVLLSHITVYPKTVQGKMLSDLEIELTKIKGVLATKERRIYNLEQTGAALKSECEFLKKKNACYGATIISLSVENHEHKMSSMNTSFKK